MNAILLALALATGVEHEFVYRAEAQHQKVSLAGTFNNWNKDAWPMKPDGDGRTWRFSTKLDPGKHLYKFVLDGDKWIVDPKAAKNEDDGGGNINSVLMILPEGFDKPAKLRDGSITLSAVRHVQEPPFLNWDQGILEIQLSCRPGDIQQIQLRTGKGSAPMKEIWSDEFSARYSARVPWDRKKNLPYSFVLKDGGEEVSAGSFVLTPSKFHPIAVPAWPETTVQYQIFPDRFENGDKSNDPKGVVAWNSTPQYFNFFGGDFAGVRKRLGYLKDLGIGAIYFNPIFQSPSNHGYETVDYQKVEPRFGTNEEFSKLTRDLKASGIRVILDGVFNHCATTFGPFKDVLENGSQSTYRDWFYVKSFPLEVRENPPYEAWFGFPSMPKVNLGNRGAAEYMLRVPEYWNEKAAIAGWRLDVANEVPMSYWREFRKTIKGLKKDAWICGEHWGDATPWLKGDQWDASMNYPWREAMLQFVANDSISANEFLKRLVANYRMYVPQVSRNMMNLLSSHDTPRFLTMCKSDRDLALMGATIQFGWPGMPSVYYGEELGMEGGRDPDNRRGMSWDLAKNTNPYLTHYKKLIRARRESNALQSGEPIALQANDAEKTFAFARVLGDEVALVAVNRSDKSATLEFDLKGKVPLSPTSRSAGAFDNVLSGDRVSVSSKGSVLIRLEPKSAALLVRAKTSSKLAVGSKQLAVRTRGAKTVRSRQLIDMLGQRARGSGRFRSPELPTANRQLPTLNAFLKSIGRHDAHKS